MPWRIFLRKFDWLLFSLVLVVGFLGLTSLSGIGARSAEITQRYSIFLILGLIIMAGVSLFDYRVFKNSPLASLLIYGGVVGLLLPTLFSHAIRGTSAWIVLFDKYQFQPSEFAKLGVLILLAKYFSQKHVEIHRTQHIIVSGIYTAIPAFLTFIQPDLGSTMIFVFLWLAMLFFAGVKRKHLFVLVVSALVIFSVGWFFVLKPYQKNRIIAFINPYIDARGIGYNTIQAQTTVGSGQWFGSLLSKKSLTVLVPEPYTDFAFAAYAQKFGFVGVVLMFALLGGILFRLGSIGARAHNNFAKLFIFGFMVIIFSHIVINAGMNLGVLPITGIPLSFLSYGGSHFITLMLAMGIVQSIKLYG